MNGICVFDPNSSYNSAKISGLIKFHQCKLDMATWIHIKLSGFRPGTTHGFHCHSKGDLTDGCASTCSHFNPTNQLHGSTLLHGRSHHTGDLCNNITADSKGNVDFSYHDDLVDLSGEHSIIGRSTVIHADPDDLGKYRNEKTPRGVESGKTGNAGKRIACAIIGISSDGCPT